MTKAQLKAKQNFERFLQVETLDFDELLEKVLSITTYKKAAEIAGYSEGMITAWRRTSFSRGLTETENRIIDRMAAVLGFSIRRDETRKAFARRVLETAIKKFPKYQIAELSDTSLEMVKLLFRKRRLHSLDKTDWISYKKVQENIRRLVAKVLERKIDRQLVRLLLHATKSASKTASLLNVNFQTISMIKRQETRKDPNWLRYACSACGTIFAPRVLSQRYCSDFCRDILIVRMKAVNTLKIPRETIRTLLRRERSATRVAEILDCSMVTISNVFRTESKKDPNWLIYDCPKCGIEFPPKFLYQQFCSKLCQARESRNRRRKEVRS